jgi:hypothetical protein
MRYRNRLPVLLWSSGCICWVRNYCVILYKMKKVLSAGISDIGFLAYSCKGTTDV